MVESKSWNWDIVTDDFWNIPSEDVYYYLFKWKKLGFKTFLDLGCGLGRHSIFFAENGFNVYSFDLSESGLEKFIEQTKKNKLSINIKLGDMLSLPYENNYFDCILAYHSIYHTDSFGIKQVISEINRVLRKNGEAFLTFNSKNNPSFLKSSNKIMDKNTVIKTEGNEMNIPHYYVNIEDIKKLLIDFKIITIRQIEDIWDENSSWHYFVNIKKI
jgi:ubiquinone/menaquinone biosynthesis C-methylase UbiE